MTFQRNEGFIEQIIRVALGLTLLAVALITLQGVFQWVAIVLGIVMLLTGLVGFCPLYTVIGMVTKQKDVCPTCSTEEAASLNKSK
jgi:hypothetical protein